MYHGDTNYTADTHIKILQTYVEHHTFQMISNSFKIHFYGMQLNRLIWPF